MYFVYILKGLKSGIYYKGQTSNIDKRLDQHFLGKVKTTKRLIPLILVYVEICSSRTEARNLEVYFKSGSGREVIKELDI